MRITFISDTHNKHNHLTSNAFNNILGSGDILVHSGDLTSVGRVSEVKSFLDWFSKTNYTHKIFIAGNHDWWFVKNHDIPTEYKDKGVHYLFDSGVEINGIKFWGSPWQPEFYDWAFNLPRGEKLAEKWALIPNDTDILMTHGPVFGILDSNPVGQRVGCEDLYLRVMEISPKIHVCGHIHCSYGQKYFNEIEFLNASTLNERYEYENKPISLFFDPESKKIVEYF